jgi:hypothetical protein
MYYEKKVCVLQEKVLSFGPNRTVEVRPNSLAEPNVRLVTITRGSKSCQVCHVADALDKVGAFPENVRSKAPQGSKVMALSYGLRGQP